MTLRTLTWTYIALALLLCIVFAVIGIAALETPVGVPSLCLSGFALAVAAWATVSWVNDMRYLRSIDQSYKTKS